MQNLITFEILVRSTVNGKNLVVENFPLLSPAVLMVQVIAI